MVDADTRLFIYDRAVLVARSTNGESLKAPKCQDLEQSESL